MSENTTALKDKLFMKRKNGRLVSDESVLKAADDFCKGYADFLDSGKTERECVKAAVEILSANGFSEYDPAASYKAGDRVYRNVHNKSVIAAVFGTESLANGTEMVCAHIDSPRLDLKPNPLYEAEELALFKTHYYGGIKKYQWTAIPMSLHGVIIKKDGTTVEVKVGEDASDPCFVVTDLLPHLAADQSKRTLSDGIRGEELNVLVGSHPFKDDSESELVKLNILSILFDKYGITEEDFLSAELECVPAFKAQDVGFDRALMGAYGHDDRVCAYPALMAICNTEKPAKTAIIVLADKEEIGSCGNTGLESSMLRDFICDIAAAEGVRPETVLCKSECLSADVNAALDPTFPEVHERMNAAKVNYGAVITKYTGARGKSGTSDANAEFVAEVRRYLDKAGVVWQTGELGKVDMGGGGTVAVYVANLGVNVVDLGVPVLSMHAPFEVVGKFDVYMTYLACYEFFKK